VELEGQAILREHAQIRYHATFTGLVTVSNRGFVGLNTELTAELIEEGYVREMVSKMQMMRKEINYNVTDHVTFSVQGDAELVDILKRNAPYIQQTVLVQAFTFETEDGDLTKEWDVNGKPLTLTVKK
jgi:isoleucyl-tRNA synthetase